MKKTKIAILLAATLALAGCEAMKPYVGPLAGGAIGGAICNAYFKGQGKEWLATSLCAAGGALIGKVIQDKLQESEKPVLAEATYTTLQTGQKQTVVTNEGTTIITEPVVSAVLPVEEAAPAAEPVKEPPKNRKQSKPSSRAPQSRTAPKAAAPVAKPEPAAVPAPTTGTTVAEGECGEVRQTIVLKNKERYVETIKACKKDGVWVG